MNSSKVASRYAKALLDLAIEQNAVDTVLANMQTLAVTVKESRDFELLLASPVVNASKKISIFNEIFGSFEKISKLFIELITKKGREMHLGEIAEAYMAQVNTHKGITPITIVSAVQLDEATKNTIIAKVKGIVSGELAITEKVDPTIIGGFIVRMDDKQIDASVASKLGQLKQRLTK